MYAVKEVSREEWLFRGLAIAMVLAMVGLTVMPSLKVGNAGVALMVYGATHHDGANFLSGLTSAGGALYEGTNIAVTLATEEISMAYAVGVVAVGIPVLGIVFA